MYKPDGNTGGAFKLIDTIAFDRKSVRTFDDNGFMRVSVSPFTKAQVVPYYGYEIPGYKDHGLDPHKVYYGYRPAEELSKPETIASINGIPVQKRHHAEFADAPAHDTRVGAAGTDAKWDDPYLTNSLIIYDKTAQDDIKSGALRELSLAYHYRPDFTPGEYKGQKYDFIMRDIRGNHIALVEEGRAGADVLVYDAQIKKLNAQTGDPTMDEKKLELMQALLDALKGEKKLADVGTDAEAEATAGPAPLTDEEKKQLKELLARYNATEGTAEAAEPAGDACKDEETVEESETVETVTDEDVADPLDGEAPAEDEGDDLSAEEEWKPTEDEKAIIHDGGYDDEDPRVQRAFAEGVKYGEEKEKAEPAKLDSEHESEGEKKALGEDAATVKRLAKLFNQHNDAMHAAANAVKPVLGEIRLSAYDSAGEIYRKACKQLGLKCTLKSARDVFNAAYRKQELAQDSAAKTVKPTGALDKLLSNVRK